MRKTFIAATAFAALMITPNLAAAQGAETGAAAGATPGAVTGAIVGGPVGAAAGAVIGGSVGAAAGDAADRSNERTTVIEERSPTVTERTCVEGSSGASCVETRR